jgi:hypothetical protein
LYLRRRYRGVVVDLLRKVVVLLTMVAGLLAATGASLPGAIPPSVPPLCVQLPLLGGGVQAGYCP